MWMNVLSLTEKSWLKLLRGPWLVPQWLECRPADPSQINEVRCVSLTWMNVSLSHPICSLPSTHTLSLSKKKNQGWRLKKMKIMSWLVYSMGRASANGFDSWSRAPTSVWVHSPPWSWHMQEINSRVSFTWSCSLSCPLLFLLFHSVRKSMEKNSLGWGLKIFFQREVHQCNGKSDTCPSNELNRYFWAHLLNSTWHNFE